MLLIGAFYDCWGASSILGRASTFGAQGLSGFGV